MRAIKLISPAGKFGNAEKATADIQMAIKIAQEYLPNVIAYEQNTFSDLEPYHANTDAKRFAELEAALTGEEEVLWCIRGGYGSARLLPYLAKMQRPAKPKLLIGFSDITALHLFFSQEWGWTSVHAMVFRQINAIANNAFSVDGVQKVASIINSPNYPVKLEELTPINAAARNNIAIEGKVTGGNLTTISSLAGTSWALDARNKIICLEDIGEVGYKIDRMLNQLHQSGAFTQAKAIIFGDFYCNIENKEDVTYALQRFADATELPVYQTFSFGHNNLNSPFLYNVQAELIFDKQAQKAQLNFLHS